MVESQPSKLLVAGSIPVSRSNFVEGKPSTSQPCRRVSVGQHVSAGRHPRRRSAKLRRRPPGHRRRLLGPRVPDFLRSLDRSSLRIRDFEIVLGKGLLGTSSAGDYSRLCNADQGQIREFYLASLEHVAPELRNRFFKLYAYY